MEQGTPPWKTPHKSPTGPGPGPDSAGPSRRSVKELVSTFEGVGSPDGSRSTSKRICPDPNSLSMKSHRSISSPVYFKESDPQQPGPEPEPGHGPGPGPGPKLGPRPGPKPGSRPGSGPRPEPGPRPSPGARPGPRPAPGPKPGPGPSPGARPGPGPAPEPGPICGSTESDSEAPEIQISTLREHLLETLKDLVNDDFKEFKWFLNNEKPSIPKYKLEHADRLDTVDLMVQAYHAATPRITEMVLKMMKKPELEKKFSVNFPVSERTVNQCQQNLKLQLQEKFQCVFEGLIKAGNPKTLLNQIYTELYITEGQPTEVNQDHEVRQIETASRKPQTQVTITCQDIFKTPPDTYQPIRVVLTKGGAGIGKTVSTQKFSLDWAEDKANQDIHFIFPFSFRELNVLKQNKFSLVGLVHHFFPETREAGIWIFKDYQVVFILDGLDECRPPLDFNNTEILTDVTESTSVDVLLMNLIRGNLLPSARLWITTRPAAANQIPDHCVSMVTEVRGFTDPQKEEYFKKRFRDEEQSNAIISHIKQSRSVHIMCHIPVFCWIIAKVLGDALETAEGKELPKTLTEMYIRFLVVQAKVKNIKYEGRSGSDQHWSPETKKMIESLGKLAFEQLKKGNLTFYEKDLTECGIDIRSASVYSGVFTEFFIEDKGLQDKAFCFIHLSVQEFMAALHVHQTFIDTRVNLLSEEQTTSQMPESTRKQFYQTAVNQALQSPNGHLDLFLRFLLGLSLPTNHRRLQGLMKEAEISSGTSQRIAQYIRSKIKEKMSVERSINLFHCLNELGDRSLVDQIQQYLRDGHISGKRPSQALWSALVFMLLTSDTDLDEFDLNKYSDSEEALLNLLPVINASNKAVITVYGLSKEGFESLSSVLRSQSCRLRHLDLSTNDLEDSGVKILSDGLRSPDCQLETLRLSIWNLSERSCEGLSSVLISQSCSLTHLGLNTMDLKDPGMKILSDGLRGQDSQLETLRLSTCNLSEKICEGLSSVLSSQSCSLIHLDLDNTDLKDSRVKILSDGLKSSDCKLETLRLSGCLITEEGGSFLVSALKSNPTHLRQLDLSYNHLGASGQELSALVEDPHWALDTVRLEPSGVQWLKPGLRKYFCELTLDANTVNKHLKLSENNKKVEVGEVQPYPDHQDRFEVYTQLMCSNDVTGRCYWEVEWSGDVFIAVTYRGIRRKGDSEDCVFGWNDHSWSLNCYEGEYDIFHNNKLTGLPQSTSSPSSGSVSVYVDCPAGSVSFYRVSSDKLTHIYTINTTFTEPLFAGFTLTAGSTVSLCNM